MNLNRARQRTVIASPLRAMGSTLIAAVVIRLPGAGHSRSKARLQSIVRLASSAAARATGLSSLRGRTFGPDDSLYLDESGHLERPAPYPGPIGEG
jgi:hypothetical protein